MPLLQWLSDDEARAQSNHVPYRLLEEQPELSYGDPTSQNMLIQGDNLDALKALLPYYAGKVKCIYIDPPYNTKSEFDFYFPNTIYPATKFYKGAYQFEKHYYGNHRIGELKDKGEEFQCAQLIDMLPEVEYWVRNLDSRLGSSFKIAKATGWFYPDFVAKLKDGRIFVVEYKGAHLVEGTDTNQKSLVGKLWEDSSNGRGLFLMAEKVKSGISLQDQLKNKIIVRN